VGFEVITLDGRRGWLARVDFPGPHRVGKYGVDVAGFEAVALPAMKPGGGVDLVIIDEVGKMECLSPRFIAAMEQLWTAPPALVATVALKGGGYLQALKAKSEARLLPVTPANRERLPREILEMLALPGSRG
jgi:nucleoside-triphosphatase